MELCIGRGRREEGERRGGTVMHVAILLPFFSPVSVVKLKSG